MADERLYTINVRSEMMKAPIYKRTAKAISAIREFVQHHMKNDNVRIQNYLNMHMTAHGMKNPPTRIKVRVWKEKVNDLEVVKVELADAPEAKPVEAQKETKKEEKVQTPEAKEKKDVLMHEGHEHKESKKATAIEVSTKKPFDTEKTTKVAPRGSQSARVDKRK